MTRAAEAPLHVAADEPLAADALVAGALAFVMLLAAFYWVVGVVPLFLFLAVHIGCVMLAGVWAWRSSEFPRRQAVLLAIMTTALGGIGAVGTLMAIGLEALFRRYATPFTVWYDNIFPDEEAEDGEIFFDRLISGGDPVTGAAQISSFSDVLTFGSIEQKQAIIALIAKRFTPEFAPALRQALEDPIAAVRVQAAAAAAAIEHRFSERGMALEREVERTNNAVEAERKLARHYADFAASGLVEAQRATDAAELAFAHFDNVLQQQPNDGEALIATARILLERDNAQGAVVRLERAIQSLGARPAVASLYVEALIRLNRFADVRRAARAWAGRFPPGDREGERLNEALAAWIKPEAAHG